MEVHMEKKNGRNWLNRVSRTWARIVDLWFVPFYHQLCWCMYLYMSWSAWIFKKVCVRAAEFMSLASASYLRVFFCTWACSVDVWTKDYSMWKCIFSSHGQFWYCKLGSDVWTCKSAGGVCVCVVCPNISPLVCHSHWFSKSVMLVWELIKWISAGRFFRQLLQLQVKQREWEREWDR